MREIKFRAIIPERNAIIYFDLTDLVHPSRKDLFSQRELLIPWLLAGNKPDEYIGLKEENGKEIYEGDVAEVECECGFKGNATVEYKHNAFKLDYPYQHRFSSGELEFNRMNRVRIIGNISENPELLIEK